MTRFPTALLVFATAVSIVSGGARAARAQFLDPAVLRGPDAPPNALWLEQLDFSAMTSGWGTPMAGKTVEANPLLLGRVLYPRGIGTHSASEWTVALHGEAVRFLSFVGVLDEVACGERAAASVRYLVKADGRVVADSGAMRWGDAPRLLDADVTGAARLTLVVDPVDTIHMDHAAWAGALLVLAPEAPSLRAAARPAAAVKPRVLPKGVVPLSTATEALRWLNGANLPSGAHALDALVAAAQVPGSTPVATAKAPFPLGGVTWLRGVPGLAERELEVDLGGQAHRFMSFAGILDDAACAAGDAELASARFQVFVDGVKKADSGAIGYGSEPVLLAVDLVNARTLRLVVQGGMAPDREAAAWAGAVIAMGPGASFVPTVRAGVPEPPVPMASGTDPRPAIHHPRVVGTTPGRAFLFRIPATGTGPLTYSASGLPAGVALDAATGILRGSVTSAGTSVVRVAVAGPSGRATSGLRIVAAEHALAQTPPLGWNSWNVWGLAVDEAKVKQAADAMVASGLAARGFSYVNVDDGWQKGRDADGEIVPNEKFPDMKALADYVHSKGLKLGIYSSPGPKTCGGYEGSYRHEAQDARTYARWGVDYLKYDWCSYGEIVKGDASLPTMKKPYEVMRAALDTVDRDVVLSLCQYGMGKVWEWGSSVGGDLWRTTGDITDTWSSLNKIGFGQKDLFPFAGPSAWNDPDMLVVGTVGWGPRVRPSRLSPNEQVTHVTLWAMLAAPMLLGSDMAQLDPLTLDLLTNDEVLAVDQDPLGKQGRQVKADDDGREVWARELEDGTRAVALFNRGAEPSRVEVSFADLGLTGQQAVRDLWAKKDLGRPAEGWGAVVPRHGARLLKVGTPRQQEN
jgi:alpha-galactosidase